MATLTVPVKVLLYRARITAVGQALQEPLTQLRDGEGWLHQVHAASHSRNASHMPEDQAVHL